MGNFKTYRSTYYYIDSAILLENAEESHSSRGLEQWLTNAHPLNDNQGWLHRQHRAPAGACRARAAGIGQGVCLAVLTASVHLPHPWDPTVLRVFLPFFLLFTPPLAPFFSFSSPFPFSAFWQIPSFVWKGVVLVGIQTTNKDCTLASL